MTSCCKKCRGPIEWGLNENNNLVAYDPGTDDVHFATCSERRRLNTPKDRCHVCDSRNVEQGPGQGPHFASLRCVDCSAHRWLGRSDFG